ncbi:hypothetical protein NIES267_71930 (plasmid) [Calothrix parasitica NIES-267]|uniref:DUF1822 family protein n=1 Tax=Calothrix parasitica NIES-267 TaxID=1973488 RepID=A0A1Z4M2F8_9CYAN|nr:hypothetical protein NIES267_71930 [Calothrix parasitica NIES-267]
MRTPPQNSPYFNMQDKIRLLPQPGEIWELSRTLKVPQDFSVEEFNQLYSQEARRFLLSESAARYVMIVTEPELPVEQEEEWQVISVMVLSEKTSFISDVDLLIPTNISGLTQEILAETWHIQSMLVCNLSKPVGNRISYQTYEILLSVGDYYHGLINQPPTISNIHDLGLKVGNSKAKKADNIKLFHQQELAWSDVLSVPIAACRTYLKNFQFTNELLLEALQIEADLTEIEREQNAIKVLSSSIDKTRIILNRWLQNIFEEEWEKDFFSVPSLATATRNNNESEEINQNEIATLIKQLSVENDEHQRQSAAKRLGEVAVGNSNAIQALVKLLRSTSDDETLWSAVESLRKIDPSNPATGIRRVKLVDLGMQIAGNAVALAVALVQKVNDEVGVLVQVYPTNSEDYLPPDLQLLLLSESGVTLREVTARRADVCLQLKFSGSPSEKFSIKVALREANIIEDFII